MNRSVPRRPRRCIAVLSAAIAVAGMAAGCAGQPSGSAPGGGPGADAATGPLAWLLASSTDLGTSHRADIGTVLALRTDAAPVAAQRWAAAHQLSLDWTSGADWALAHGSASAMAAAFGVSIHDYRARDGARFYATGQDVAVPTGLGAEVEQVGRILSYAPRRVARPVQDVPPGGLSPSALLNAYDAAGLAQQGFTGKGSTVVFFEWTPAPQADLDAFTKKAGLPQMKISYFPAAFTADGDAGETLLDVEVVHAIVPDAKLVVVNANATLQSDRTGDVGVAIAKQFGQVDAAFPGAVWSLSIGWGCDRVWKAADVRPVEQALAAAASHGTDAFDASGDNGGLECKDGDSYSTPPNESDVGLDAIASLPTMTDIGGTNLSTDAAGHWAAEQTWTQSSASQGGSGGTSQNLARPPWQQAPGVSAIHDTSHRLTPDVAADADPDSGVAIVSGGQPGQGGGTSQAAPIWAGLMTIINEYLAAHGGHNAAPLNPLLYRIAGSSAQQQAFHDITLGGNVVDAAAPGYDEVTGLGSPITSGLAAALLTLQGKGTS